MGTLAQNDIRLALPARALVGRAPGCDLVIGHGSISREHAALWWADGAWRVRDLGSRNGTTVDGRRIGDDPVSLAPGAELQFGLAVGAWVLVDDTAPADMPALASTVGPEHPFASIAIGFEVSSDEEHVRWYARLGRRRVDLGDRSYTYTLVTLARARLADPDGGWMDAASLARGLDITPEVLKVYVYRGRAALAGAGVPDARALIERRTGSGQIRLGTARVTVTRVG